ncbi:hypothetical protein NDU88_002390 [Pleurodeles waltl]|uniref:Secreted protein n=1 Tax=Pleurodeles waltl TaxID=8319 RepID=A0AAV7NDV7_PLEWA|nr:hypothetical protein NDU88_002390 [Pleurodeles waltl]
MLAVYAWTAALWTLLFLPLPGDSASPLLWRCTIREEKQSREDVGHGRSCELARWGVRQADEHRRIFWTLQAAAVLRARGWHGFLASCRCKKAVNNATTITYLTPRYLLPQRTDE